MPDEQSRSTLMDDLRAMLGKPGGIPLAVADQEEKERFMGGDNMGEGQSALSRDRDRLIADVELLNAAIKALLRRIERLEGVPPPGEDFAKIARSDVGGNMGGKGEK